MRHVIIGPEGEVIKHLRKTFDVKIDVPEKTDVDGFVVVTGLGDKVTQAIENMNRKLQE